MDKALEKRFEEIEELATKMGLDFFPVVFEEVPQEIIWDVASYGLPTRMSHWSFGRTYLHQKTHGEMGFSKIYELILNNNPSYAFLDDTNPDVVNLLICAHCYLPGTYVQTNRGIKPIEDVCPDDRVWNHEGKSVSVERLTSREYRGDVVTIQCGSYSFTQTEDHKLRVIQTDPADRTKYRSWKSALKQAGYEPAWVEAEQIKAGDFLIVKKPTDIGNGTIGEISIDISKTLWRQNIEDTVQIPLNREFGQLIGLYLAEGYARKKGNMGLCFSTEEKELHRISKKLVEKYFGLKTYDNIDEETHSHAVLFNEICIANYLRDNLGCSCYKKRLPPEWLKNAPKDFLEGVLIGYLKGDGIVCQSRSIGFSTTSPVLAVQIQQIALMLGIFVGIYPKDGSTDDQKRAISFVGSSSGVHDTVLRGLLKLGKRDLSRTWSGAIDLGTEFAVKVQSLEKKHYEGPVHCLYVPDGNSFTLANGVVTHNCLGHSDFFKKNACFAKSNRNMVNQAERNAKMIDMYKEKYGIDAVEDWMDAAFSIDRHIDPVLGENRKRYPDIEHVFKEKPPKEYADLFGEEDEPQVVEEIKNEKFPPHKERDLLWFLATYSPRLLPWQREVLSIIRSEAYYFHPQGQTKIMNEGWASFWHAEILYNYDNMSAAEYAEFSKYHSGVVRPGRGSINPYYVGFRIFTDVKKRWDEAYKEGQNDKAFQKGDKVDLYDEDTGKLVASKVDGTEKIFQIREMDDDYSFIHNYLTRELCDDMKMFTYGPAGNVSEEDDPFDDDLVIVDRELHRIRDVMTRRLHNNGAPPIVVESVEDNTLRLLHEKSDGRPLDEKYARETMKYIYKTWKGPVVLKTRDRFGQTLHYKQGTDGLSARKSNKDTKSFTLNI